MCDNFQELRRQMVGQQIQSRGVKDPQVLAAMRRVPRELFLAESDRHWSYDDGPLAIGHGQTISQPYIVAYMTELLELAGTERVLEIGTGSGYQTAVLAELARFVYSIEVIEALSLQARKRLSEDLKYRNIQFQVGRGQEGWPSQAPFDRIILTAAPEKFPEPLFHQLAEDGIALSPVGDFSQRMVRFRKTSGRMIGEELIAVSFVPLV
jgi:protein-L-isoaspartate(D-aspartate) O-methyltransferase